MGKIMMTRKEFEAKHAQENCCGSEGHKKLLTLLGMIAVITIATSGMSWIGFMTIKHHGGKLPWEN